MRPKARAKPTTVGKDGTSREVTEKLADTLKDSFKEKNTPMTEGQKNIQRPVNKTVKSAGLIKSWKFLLMTQFKMLTAIKFINPIHSEGPDKPRSNFLRSVAELLTPNLLRLANMILTSGFYPKVIVCGKAQPVYKGKRKEEVES